MTIDLTAVSKPVDVPEELEREARRLGWADGLVKRAVELRIPLYDIEHWQDRKLSTDRVQEEFDRRERLMFGTLCVREATPDDDEALIEMYAHAPEEIGDWMVTTERSPNPFAQLWLQENTNMVVMEDRGAVFGAHAHSTRNSIVGGRRLSVHVQTAFRLREEVRGLGYSHLLRMSASPACSWIGMFTYYYVRSDNVGALEWIKAVRPEPVEGLEHEGVGVAGKAVSVYHLTPRLTRSDPTVRQARPADLEPCVDLINRTHDGLDLFRPYSAEFLRNRLDGPVAGLRPDYHNHVYGWEDFYVVEADGQVMACGGLWDRGRDIREVWRHKETGERRTVASTALMDFGCAERREDALAGLIGHLAGRTADLGRDTLIAPIEHLPGVLERLSGYDPAPETRAIQYEAEPDIPELEGLTLERPYTDLAYW